MKVVIQRVLSAGVDVEGNTLAQIKQGLVVFLGISGDDCEKQAVSLVKKILALRIFEKEGKIDQSLTDRGFDILIVSQFTLMANTLKGNRPSFIQAAKPDVALRLYKYFIDECKKLYDADRVFNGEFGANMKVNLVNDGPFTIILDH